MYEKEILKSNVMKEVLDVHHKRLLSNDKNQKINLRLIADKLNIEFKDILEVALSLHDDGVINYIPIENCEGQGLVTLTDKGKLYFKENT